MSDTKAVEKDVSLITTVLLVATMVPLVESVLSLTWNDSSPSFSLSFLTVIVNEAALLFIVRLPLSVVIKSSALIVPETPSIVQYKTVPFDTFAVVIFAVAFPPSSTEETLI